MAELSSLYTIYRCSLTSDLCVTWWCCRLLLRQTPSSNPEGYIMIAVSRNVLIYSRCKFVLTWRKQKLKGKGREQYDDDKACGMQTNNPNKTDSAGNDKVYLKREH
uniref:Uncharacterized protein n=1 Tax=Physcomitrium patens TaxID=3218 RepID=A0A2K1J905_PHYPA|nr:hypothetical protein PHYPA_021117 [Physcomitrium patens]